MFGFSFTELIMVIIVMIIFIKPQDLPEIFRFLGKAFYRGKHFINNLKKSLREVEKDFGFDDLKAELNQGIAEEKIKLKNDVTVIVDMYGNEHEVSDIHEIRPDISKEELEKNVEEENEVNLQRVENSKNNLTTSTENNEFKPSN
jgi:Sec-independent protein translocase protein TatA